MELDALRPKWEKLRPRARRQLTLSLALAASMVGFALLCGALVWVMSGSRTQALQFSAEVLLVELIAVCFVTAMMLAVKLGEK